MPYSNLNDLYKAINKQVAESMQKDVVPVVKEIEQKAIQETVFDVYDPFQYQRRTTDGINDVNNMVDDIQIVGNKVVMSITNMTRGSNQSDLYIAPLIEYGDSNGYGEYQYKVNRDNTQYLFLQPRPFTEETLKQLQITQDHKKELLASLKRKGWNIK